MKHPDSFTLDYKVTQADIDRGHWDIAEHCPHAMAITRALKKRFRRWDLRVYVQNRFIVVHTDKKPEKVNHYVARTPGPVYDHYQDGWDNIKVSPREFTLLFELA